MTCTDCAPLLPLLATDDLAPAQTEAVRIHLDGCETCRTEAAALRDVLARLDEAPPPEANVDLPRLFAAIHEAEARKARLWRRWTIAAAALAASLLIVSFIRLEIRFEPHQFVLAWGEQRQEPTSVPREEPHLAKAEALAAKVQELEKLIELVLEDGAERDGRRAQEIAALRRGFEQLRQSAAAGIAAAERDLSALYAVQFPGKSKNLGENP